MLQCFFGLLAFSLARLTGSHADCPLQLKPQSVVVRFGDPVSVNCSTSVQHKGMGWESTVKAVPMSNVNLTTWRVSSLTEWTIEAPFCYINFINDYQCEVALPVTVYKTPDSVSISTGTHTGPMTEGQQYELQCDVHKVAPVQNLTVRWYKGQTPVDQTSFTDLIRTPVNKNAKLLINPDRADNGVQYRCEAELDLGEEGPQPPPTVSSQPLTITVYFKPIINETKLPSIVPVSQGSPEELVCEAEGNPKPTIYWILKNNSVYKTTSTITESTPKTLYCIANNSVGNTTREVNVVLRDISISVVSHTGPMIAGIQYELQCDIHNVDKSVDVRWYKEGQNIKNETIFSNITMTSVKKTSKLWIRPNKTDDGAQYKCEAVLKRGLPPYLTMSSKPLSITVNYKPKHSRSSEIVDIKGEVVLNCTVMANPAPKYSWHSENLKEQISSSVLPSSTLRAGNYICTTSNSLGEDSKVFILRSTGCRHTFWTALISLHLLIAVMIVI